MTDPHPTAPPDIAVYTIDDAAALLDLSANTLRKYQRRYDTFPEPARVVGGRIALWTRDDLYAWDATHSRRRGPRA